MQIPIYLEQIYEVLILHQSYHQQLIQLIVLHYVASIYHVRHGHMMPQHHQIITVVKKVNRVAI
jgi:hypothetical protein